MPKRQYIQKVLIVFEAGDDAEARESGRENLEDVKRVLVNGNVTACTLRVRDDPRRSARNLFSGMPT